MGNKCPQISTEICSVQLGFSSGVSNVNILERSIRIPLPVITTNNFDNEFGSVVYVTPNLAYAKKFAGRQGAITIFKETDNRQFNVWTPNLDEWWAFVAYNIGLPRRQEYFPEGWEADIIIGPVTKDTAKKPKTDKDLEPSDILQLAYREYQAFELLGRALIEVIHDCTIMIKVNPSSIAMLCFDANSILYSLPSLVPSLTHHPH